MAVADVRLLDAPRETSFVFTFIFVLHIVAAVALKTYNGFSRGEDAVSIHKTVKNDWDICNCRVKARACNCLQIGCCV